MNNLNATRIYVDAKATLDAAMAEHRNMEMNLIPRAKADLLAAQSQASIAAHALKNAVTAEEIQAARQTLALAEQAVSSQSQLKENLERRAKEFPVQKNRMESVVSSAAREVWVLKRAELMAQFEIPAAEFELLEKLVAATDGEKDGWGNKVMGDPINEKYGRLLDHERSKLLRDQMLTELIGQLPA